MQQGLLWNDGKRKTNAFLSQGPAQQTRLEGTQPMHETSPPFLNLTLCFLMHYTVDGGRHQEHGEEGQALESLHVPLKGQTQPPAPQVSQVEDTSN